MKSERGIPLSVSAHLDAADQIRARLYALGLLVTHEHPQVRIIAEATQEAASDLHAILVSLEGEIRRHLLGESETPDRH